MKKILKTKIKINKNSIKAPKNSFPMNNPSLTATKQQQNKIQQKYKYFTSKRITFEEQLRTMKNNTQNIISFCLINLTIRKPIKY